MKIVTKSLIWLLLVTLTGCNTVETRDWSLEIYDLNDIHVASITNQEVFNAFINRWTDRKRAYLKKAPEFELKFTLTEAGKSSSWMYAHSGIAESADNKGGIYYKVSLPMFESYIKKN